MEVLKFTKELVEKKFEKAKQTKSEEQAEPEGELTPETLQINSLLDTVKKDKESFISCQKFVWETYKIILDIMKTNDKLLNHYAEVLGDAFNFCRENKRKFEFKRLCDSLRGYLHTLIRSEKQTHLTNKVDISKPEVLWQLIKMRMKLLETAIELELWQESFKTAEDLMYLIERYDNNQIKKVKM